MFASALNEFCQTLNCSNTEIAQRCDMSMSSLSRYRHGQRTPAEGSHVITQLAEGIASLAREHGIISLSSAEEVEKALRDSMSTGKPLGSSFANRLDGLMKLLSIRNSDIALPLHLDSSYISRIRRGERTPQNQERLAGVAAQVAARRCMELDLFDVLVDFIDVEESFKEGARADLDGIGELALQVRRWLLGNQVLDSDIAAVLDLFEQLDCGYYEEVLGYVAQSEPATSHACELEPSRVFYRGDDVVSSAELSFLERALECGAQEVCCSRDMPADHLGVAPHSLEQYGRAVARLLASGCHLTIVHSVDRPLAEALRAMRLWIPFYMTGKVTSLYLSGMESRLFAHSNSVCECCVMSCEAVRGHEDAGQYFLSTHPDDIIYYRHKMELIKQQADSLLEIYRNDDPEGFRRFENEESERQASGRWREVCAGRYRNLKIISYSSECFVVSLDHPLQYRFVIHHPKLCYAVTHLQ